MTVEGDRSIIAEPRLAAAMTPRSWVGFAIKLLLTVAILGLLVRRADWHAVLQRASGAHRPLLLAAVAVIMVAIFLAAARWRRLMRRNGILATRSWAIRAAFTSLFIGQFLPAPSARMARSCGSCGAPAIPCAAAPRASSRIGS